MSFWATLWYAGSVVLTMGYEGQTLEQCNKLGEIIMYDITTAYDDPEIKSVIEKSMFTEDKFMVTCEKTQLPIDKKYLK